MRGEGSNDVELPYLVTFSKAAELSSFTGAAKAMRLTQAAVSQRIQSLEQMLNTPLFKRLPGRLLLTEAGQQLYDCAQRIFELHRQARSEISGREAPLSGDLFIAASSVPGEHFLPALLPAFAQKHPHLRVRAAVSDSMTVIAQVERGGASIGLVGRKTDHPHLRFRHLTSDRMVLVSPKGHALGKRQTVTLSQVIAFPLVIREAGSGLRHCFERALERAGRSLADCRVALELGSNEAIKQAVQRGAGLAVLSTLAVETEIKAGRLKAIEVSDLECDRDIFVVQDQRRVVPLPARLFLTFLESNPLVDFRP